ncbi:hypothetical protein CX648_19975 [Aeromonas dhakensis]|uniref:hypothetical protein n=1 Tax=Aeromonas dhakensis TaxID=196024 RepID=UPI0006CA489D|nr:hypothetical protein [Aeromonas dhakensis]RUQ11172.1 hypothetical protein CX648_19975 [Aeromonas dhakensis]
MAHVLTSERQAVQATLPNVLIVNEQITFGLSLAGIEKIGDEWARVEDSSHFLDYHARFLIQTSSDEGSRRAMGNHPPKK